MTNVYRRAAEVSNLSYSGVEAFQKAGFTDILKFEDEESGTEAYIVEDADYLYLTFTGTEDAKDIKTDLRFLKKDTFSNFRLHRGFWEAWRDVADQIATEIMQRRLEMANGFSKAKPLVYCGHSLGGALAVIAAGTHQPEYCVTFGAPPVGGKLFKKHCEDQTTKHVRFLFNADPVPRLLKWNPFYRHSGTLMFFDKELGLHINPGFWEMLRMRFPRLYNTDDHSLFSYRSGIFYMGGST